MSVYGLSRTVVPHLLQANSRLTPLRAHHKLLLWPPLSPGCSLCPSAWSWFSIRVEKVGVASSGLGARTVRNRFLECHGFCRTASLRTTSDRTISCRTTSARKTFRLELIERSFGEMILKKSFSQTAGLGEQLPGEQLLTNGSH